jgi:glutathione S-transferase
VVRIVTIAAFTLYGINISGPTYKVALFLALAGIEFDFVMTSPRGDAKTPAYKANLNHWGQVPVLVDNLTGKIYRQAPSILEFLADKTKKFRGKSPDDRISIREWMYWDLDRLAPPIYRLRGQRLGFRQFGQLVAEMYHLEAIAALQVLEERLTANNWLVGKGMTIADIDVYCVLDYAAAGGVALKSFPKVRAFMSRMQAKSGFGSPLDVIPKSST